MDTVVAQAIAKNDVYRTLLKKSLMVLSRSPTLETWLHELETIISSPKTDSSEKLEANAMLVGILSIMLETIQEEK